MYAEVILKNRVFQRLNEILDYLEIEYELNFFIGNDQVQMTSEDVVKAIASELEDDSELEILTEILGMSTEEQSDTTHIQPCAIYQS